MDLAPELSIVFPLTDPRGESVERILGWTRQSLSRERFEIVAVDDRSLPGIAERIRPLLAAHDQIVAIESDNVAELFSFGVLRARGRILVLTEHHCIAESDCLREIAGLFANPRVTVACLNATSREASPMARLEESFRSAAYSPPGSGDDWRRLSFGGLAIRRDALAAAGGIRTELRRFAETELAIRLHELGHTVTDADRARLTHVSRVSTRAILGFIEDFTDGEVTYLASDGERYERFFGPVPEWTERFAADRRVHDRAAALLARTIMSSLAKHGGRPTSRVLASLVPEMLGHAAAALAPEWARRRWAAAGILVARARMAFWRFDERRLGKAHVDARTRTIRRRRTLRIRERGEEPGSLEERLVYEPASLDGRSLFGFHPSERSGGRAFRWTRPVACLRLNAPRGDYVVSIGIAPVRADLEGIAKGFFWNGAPLESEIVAGPTIEIRLNVTAAAFRDAGEQVLGIVSSPLRPPPDSPETRPLGLPISTVTLRPVRR